MNEPTSILIDWGTTNFRAWLIGGDSKIIDRCEAPDGIMQVPAGGFSRTLGNHVGKWRAAHPGLPVLMAGMVGSQQGWAEAPYLDCPVGIDDLARAVMPVPGADGVHIVPGICYEAPDGRHDVMRGEEVQIFGSLAKDGKGRQVFCLPGTHSKWAAVEDGRVVWFATAMTGEVWSVMSEHSILGRLMEGAALDDMDSFKQGFALSEHPGGLLNHLFSVRAEALFGAVPTSGLRSYLSGILIGHEVRAMLPIARPTGPVTLIGRPDVTELYSSAITTVETATVSTPVEISTLHGLNHIQEAMKNG
ncbi:MAG: 2-dehydro-3-deoxygalactonokinase [Proteobacteria bacterium]|nr:2-dehydro-3-deoxygalactonokinase [Pseudomonadota bacterium]